MVNIKFIYLSLLLAFPFSVLSAQTEMDARIERDGHFDVWKEVRLEESGIVGGKEVTLYKMDGVFAPCNIRANIVGITKGSNTVFPEKRGEGYCARLEVRLEAVRVMGSIDVEALAQGTVLTGTFMEPIRNMKGPFSKVDCGIPFTGRPSFLQLDYKAQVGKEMIRASGGSSIKRVGGEDHAYIAVMLQHREEDDRGRIRAWRVGTGYKVFKESREDWVDAYRVKIHYGDVSDQDWYDHNISLRMDDKEFYAKNAKGRLVPVDESGWADSSMEPTHVIIWISSSSGGVFVGGIGNKLWVDNVRFIY